jgi:lipase ATG15
MPDVTDRTTLTTLATLSWNAYTRPHAGDWVDLGPHWNTSLEWGGVGDGLRGYLFTNEDNSVAVLVFKGTSAAFLGIGGPSSPKDRFNVSLLDFSPQIQRDLLI